MSEWTGPVADADADVPILASAPGFTGGIWDVRSDLIDFAGQRITRDLMVHRCFLARGLSPLAGGRPKTGEAEEDDLPRAWLPLDEAREAVFSGRLQNPTTVIGVLAAWSSRATGWDTLRPPDSPWPIRDRVVSTGRTTRLRS
jgi:hypothetical protein